MEHRKYEAAIRVLYHTLLLRILLIVLVIIALDAVCILLHLTSVSDSIMSHADIIVISTIGAVAIYLKLIKLGRVYLFIQEDFTTEPLTECKSSHQNGKTFTYGVVGRKRTLNSIKQGRKSVVNQMDSKQYISKEDYILLKSSNNDYLIMKKDGDTSRVYI